jgi:hypothetical protein
VDVSLDQGRHWRAARLIGPRTRYGWRLWELSWTPPAERHYTLLSRAKDSTGDVQPSVEEWNPSGYLWNVIARADVDVLADAGSTAAPPVVPAGSSVEPPPGFHAACVVCHEEDVIRQQRLNRAQWDREITKMTGWGARVSAGDRPAFLRYLSDKYGQLR